MLLVISFVVFMLLGLPLFGVIGLASIISMIGMPFPMEFIPQNLYTGMDLSLIHIFMARRLPQGRPMRGCRRMRPERQGVFYAPEI